MKRYVTFRISARYVAEVDVEDPNDLEAIKKAAEQKYYDADFGEAEDIDAVQIKIEDERGQIISED